MDPHDSQFDQQLSKYGSNPPLMSSKSTKVDGNYDPDMASSQTDASMKKAQS